MTEESRESLGSMDSAPSVPTPIESLQGDVPFNDESLYARDKLLIHEVLKKQGCEVCREEPGSGKILFSASHMDIGRLAIELRVCGECYVKLYAALTVDLVTGLFRTALAHAVDLACRATEISVEHAKTSSSPESVPVSETVPENRF